jgi:heptosyltransferase-2
MIANPIRAMVHRLADPKIARWAAPVRTLRQICGAGPVRLSVTQARRILVIRPDEIGDVVLTSPFLRGLRGAAPQAHITLLVKIACHELARNCPYVDQLERIDFHSSGTWRYRLRLILTAWNLRLKHLWFRGFDLVILPRRDPDWYGAELVGHVLAGRGTLIVHREKVVDNSPAGPPDLPVDLDSYSNPHIEHEVMHHLRFLRWCGAADAAGSELELWLSESDISTARLFLRQSFPEPGPLIVIHPSGGNSPLKQWPVEKFQELHAALLNETSANFLIIGGPGEEWISNAFASTDRTSVGVARFTLNQVAAVLGQAVLFVGGDSGPMHIAAAMCVPVVAVFGSTSEVRFRPLSSCSSVVSLRYACSPDERQTYKDRCPKCDFSEPRCLTELSVEAVLSAVRERCSGTVSAWESGGLRCSRS